MDSSTAAQIAALEAQLKANPKLAAVAEQRGLTKSKNAKKPRQAPEAEIRCMARVWGSGFGDDQCKAKRLEFGVFSCFCKRHAKQASVCEGPTWVGATGKSPVGLKFGRIDEARPWLDVNAVEGTVPFICVEWKGEHKLEVSAAIESVTAVRVRRGKPKRVTNARSKATPTVRRKPLVIHKTNKPSEKHHAQSKQVVYDHEEGQSPFTDEATDGTNESKSSPISPFPVIIAEDDNGAVVAAGAEDANLAALQDAGDADLAALIAEGDTEVDDVDAGDADLLALIAEGDTSVDDVDAGDADLLALIAESQTKVDD